MFRLQGASELTRAALAFRAASKDVQRDVNKDVRKDGNPLWRAALRKRATSPLDQRVIVTGARVQSGGRNLVSLRAATSTKALSGGLIPAWDWPGVEYGMKEQLTVDFDQRSRKGNRYTRDMRTGNQFRDRTKQGRIADDAASEVGREIVIRWLKFIVDKFQSVADGKGN